MKRFITLILSICVIFSMCVFTSYGEETHWAYSFATLLIEDGVVSGYLDGSLKLDNFITRAEFIKIINKTAGFTEKSSE